MRNSQTILRSQIAQLKAQASVRDDQIQLQNAIERERNVPIWSKLVADNRFWGALHETANQRAAILEAHNDVIAGYRGSALVNIQGKALRVDWVHRPVIHVHAVALPSIEGRRAVNESCAHRGPNRQLTSDGIYIPRHRQIPSGIDWIE